MKLVQNVGTVDCVLRLVVAAVMVALVAMGIATGPWMYAAIAVAVVMTATALVKTCGLYSLFGFSTCSVK